MHAVVRLNPLLFHLALPVFVGTLSAKLSGDMAAVYQSLRLPAFAPPAAVFGVIWTILYLLMGLAAYLVSRARGRSREDRRAVMALYAMTLVTGAMWSLIFFRFRLPVLGAVWCVLLLCATALCSAVFRRIRPLAGLLMVPSLLWIAFAGALNITIVVMN